MEVLLSKIGYNKEEKLYFLNKRLCGLWLIWIGCIITVGTVFGGKYLINPIIFGFGFFLGFTTIFRSNIFKRYLSFGKHSSFQAKMGNLSIIFMFLLMSIFSGRYFATGNYRMIWLGALLATALHFVPFSVVHGKALLYISLPLAINALIGIFFNNVEFNYIAIIDGIIKIVFGIILLMSKPPEQVLSKNQ